MSHEDGSRQACEHRHANGGRRPLGAGTQTQVAKRKHPQGLRGEGTGRGDHSGLPSGSGTLEEAVARLSLLS